MADIISSVWIMQLALNRLAIGACAWGREVSGRWRWHTNKWEDAQRRLLYNRGTGISKTVYSVGLFLQVSHLLNQLRGLKWTLCAGIICVGTCLSPHRAYREKVPTFAQLLLYLVNDSCRGWGWDVRVGPRAVYRLGNTGLESITFPSHIFLPMF